ncbi:MAG: poly-beta-1,6 N-acetyl-D-glucosamine export porin PgaA [Gammaproteobacteria bacterium]|nr:poly-beta-1,6 N-acetyl-D-glucosamine export porin PgaA [Gammaproteobacteria bacterium]
MKISTIKQIALHRLNKAVLIVIMCCVTNIASASNTDDSRYKRAIIQAQNGHYTQALASLKHLANKHAKPNRYFYDYISILGWAGEHSQIIKHSNDITLQQAPRYVLNTLAIAYRQQLNYIAAEKTYRVIGKRFPAFLNGKIGLGLVFIDQKKFKLAHEILSPLQKTNPDDSGLLDALAYYYESQQQFIAALSIYQHALALNPDDSLIFRKKIFTLNKIGASHLANSLIDDASVFKKEDLASVKTNMSAHQVRWADTPVEDETQHFDEIDIAINELEDNIKNFQAQFSSTSPFTLNAQFDLLVALRNRYRMKDTIKRYNELIASNTKVPAYAQTAVCDAYLYLERPSDAESCYLDVKQASPQENVNLDLSLFYAYVENEKMDLAQPWVKGVASKQAPYIIGKGEKPFRRPNPKKTQAETIAALSIAYADNLEVAEQKIKDLHQRAPYNTGLRKELANIDYWRGWPRKAQGEYDIGLTQEPNHLGLRIGEARNQLTLKHFEEAEDSIAALFELFPRDKGVAIQNELWGIHNMREFKTEISTSNSSGSVSGSRGLEINSYLYSRPLSNNYRAYVHQRHSQAKFTEGDGLLNHAGIGLEYTAPNIFLMTEIHHNHYENKRIGVNLNGTYEFDDHWSSSLSLESLSGQTPLRALNQGVYAKSVSWGGQYRWHESRSTGLNLSYLDFSDTNERKSINGFWKERWYSQYTYKFSTRVDLFSSRNSNSNVIYFNPESDLAGSIAFENDWLTWREYEDSFHQRLIFSTGFYNQENYSTGDTWGLQYEHRWAADYRLEVIYGVKRSSNLYDGDDELSWSYYFSLDWRF